MKFINEDLINYIENNIFPKYDKFYSHDLNHIKRVLDKCLILGKEYNLNLDMCYVMAAYHDIGLSVSRKNHEFESGKMFDEDKMISKFFDDAQLKIVKEAIEDHRGSRKEPPRNFYGKVLSDCDRDFDMSVHVRRQMATSIKNQPEFKTAYEHFEYCYAYIMKRINDIGKYNLWTNNESLCKERDSFEKLFFDKETAKKYYIDEYNYIVDNNIYDKILNYYEDF